MVQQQSKGLHKIIFTITCEGETLYDAQKLAMNVSAALEDYHIVNDSVFIEMTVAKVIKIDADFGTSTVRTDLNGDDIQASFTS